MSFLSDFLEFCKNPDYDLSHKADSYAKAINYYCDFLHININNITINDLKKIKSLESVLNMKSSEFYKQLLDYLKSRGKSSYLTGGFIRAALPYLYKFYKFN